MRYALSLVAVLSVSPASAQINRCMAIAHVGTSDRPGTITMRNAETVGPVLRDEADVKGLWLCGENHACWPAADFDIITPCAPEAMQGRRMTLR